MNKAGNFELVYSYARSIVYISCEGIMGKEDMILRSFFGQLESAGCHYGSARIF